MGTPLNKAPVCFTLAQMHFNPVLKTDDFLPALQDAFSKAGYTDYKPVAAQGMEFLQNAEGFSLNQKAVIRHVFRNKVETAALILDPATLTYELTDYSISKDFSDNFLKALGIVHEHRPIDYTDRLGMRMLDAVQPILGETLDQYVVPQALGFAGLIENGIEHQHTVTESLFQSGPRTLLVRTLRARQQDNGIVVPPDLMPLRLKLDQRFLTYQGEIVMLDCDSFRTERMDFSVETAATELRELKSALSRSFKVLVTPHALDVWK